MIEDMTDIIIVASLIIAACSLAVNIVAGLGERKRPFSLLRLTGAPTKLLHRVVALESALPLLLVAVVSIVVGLGSAALYLHSQVDIAFRFPGIAYWATVVGGFAASLAIIALTFPLINRMTGPEVARND
jgi:predicted lysophospholipase L1 biosynthesis ABC-type transport system permease subunit